MLADSHLAWQQRVARELTATHTFNDNVQRITTKHTTKAGLKPSKFVPGGNQKNTSGKTMKKGDINLFMVDST
jgi:hypothetical protein